MGQLAEVNPLNISLSLPVNDFLPLRHTYNSLMKGGGRGCVGGGGRLLSYDLLALFEVNSEVG